MVVQCSFCTVYVANCYCPNLFEFLSFMIQDISYKMTQFSKSLVFSPKSLSTISSWMCFFSLMLKFSIYLYHLHKNLNSSPPTQDCRGHSRIYLLGLIDHRFTSFSPNASSFLVSPICFLTSSQLQVCLLRSSQPYQCLKLQTHYNANTMTVLYLRNSVLNI